EGQKTLQYFLAVSLLGSILFGGIIMGVLQTQVLDPVTRLSKDLQDIPRSTTRRVSVVGSDELTALARVINEMLGKIEETSDRYRRLFQSSPISLWEEDFSGVKKYLDELRGRGIRDFRTYFIEHPEDVSKCSGLVKTLDVNQATLTLYKAKNVSEFVNGLSKVLTKESLDNFREELLALAEGKIKFESEFINQTLAGDVKHISVIMSVIPGYEDTLAKILVSIIDLTERKLMEERLLKAERMATIGETAAMVAHDLRNPLQGITSAVYVLKNNSLTADQENEMFQIIGSSVEYAEAIVRDLMDYSREIHLARAESQPREIIQSALEAVKVPSNVEVRDLSQEQPAISVDPDRMKRVFINLIENAVDATPQGGTLTIQTTELNGHMEIKVSDTGTGMPKKIMENLWIPMQTTKSKGMGLGLPIVKRIIDAHSGEITVNSRQGEGTTFIIRLPIKATT
ncbi:MAG TPA: ATP-binding protein, partial [Terriglobales bacterium]|nr:ATP-binding protein [Terriglobales bacterium]